MVRKLLIGIILTLALFCLGCDVSAEPDAYEPEVSDEQEEFASQGAPEETLNDILADDIAAGYLILVNKSHGLDRNYKPDDLAGIRYFAADRSAEGRFMRASAAGAFHSLVEEGAAQGIDIVMTTAFRSFGFQETLYNNYVANHGQAAADRFSAKPGFSEHQTGLAVDVSAASVGYRLTRDFANTKEGRWIAENAHLFGFILRYPEGMEEFTGYMFEPWHLRFVGKTAAKYIFENNLILEDFLRLIEEEMEE